MSVLFPNPWLTIALALLIGSIPFGLLVGRIFFRTDIRSAGSGNIGAANALRTMGPKAGIAVLVLDALKGVAATLLPVIPVSLVAHRSVVVGMDLRHLCAACALAAVAGHCYSPWLRFRGGKGVATFLGVLFVAAWPSAVTFMLVWLAIVVPTGYASLGSILGALAAIAIVAKVAGSWSLLVSVPMVAVIVWKHRDNIGRLLAGNEHKLDLFGRGNGRKAPEPGNASS